MFLNLCFSEMKYVTKFTSLCIYAIYLHTWALLIVNLNKYEKLLLSKLFSLSSYNCFCVNLVNSIYIWGNNSRVSLSCENEKKNLNDTLVKIFKCSYILGFSNWRNSWLYVRQINKLSKGLLKCAKAQFKKKKKV